MNFDKIPYNPNKIRPSFKNKLKQFKNIIYFFYLNNDCLYIGETNKTLYDRCYINTPKESSKPWFKQANTIFILELDNKIDSFARRTLESLFITVTRPKYNKKS